MRIIQFYAWVVEQSWENFGRFRSEVELVDERYSFLQDLECGFVEQSWGELR